MNTVSVPLRTPGPLERAWVFAAVSWVVLLALLSPIVPHDFWWHLALGRQIVEQGSIPGVDALSFTRRGVEWHDQSWLVQVIFFGLHRVGGVPAIAIANAAAVGLAYVLLLRLCVRRSNDWGLSAGLLVLAIVPASLDNWMVRPQTLVLPLFVGSLSVLEDHLAGRAARLWLLPLLMLAWVNMHGTFVLGFALVGLAALSLLLDPYVGAASGTPREERDTTHARLRRLLPWAAMTAAASLVNPQGAAVFVYVAGLVGNEVVTAFATEWAPPTTRDATGAVFFMLAIGTGALAAYLPRRPRLSDAMFGVAFFWLAIGAGRHVIWFAFVVAPVLVASVSHVIGAPADRRRARGNGLRQRVAAAVVIVLSVAAVMAGSPWLKARWAPPHRAALLSPDTPIAAVEFVKEEPWRPRRLFHSLGYGSYLTWALPDQPVFVDPRLELYPRELWLDYLALNDARNITALLAKYELDGLLLNLNEQKPLVDAARSSPDAWLERYHDETTAYFVARTPFEQHRPLATSAR